MTTDSPDIRFLFEPRSTAVIGASSDRGKIGFKLVENIVSGGYEGRIIPVNPKGGEVLGLPMHTSLDDVDGPIDLATLAVPARMVFDTVRQCAARQVKYLSIVTSGFSEVGNSDEERKIVAFARSHGMRVLGPNIFGIYSAPVRINATFGPKEIVRGNVAIITQSGALGIAMIGRTAVENVGLSAIVSVGNKSDIDEADLLAYLVAHEDTRVIMLYIEGVGSGQRLVDALKAATRVKPVVVIKSGRSRRGAVAAASHTGSLAGADGIFDAIMRQCGVLRAESLDDAFNWCKFLADSPVPPGENTVIVTNGGGVGVMATDASEKHGIELYDDAASLKACFKAATPDFGSTKNPVDITGQAGAREYTLALDAALEAKSIHSVMALYCETALFDVDALVALIRENCARYRNAGKPILFSIIGGAKVEAAISRLKTERVPVFGDVYAAVSCMGALYRHTRHLAEKERPVVEPDIDVAAVEEMVARARRDNRQFLLPAEAHGIMKAVGIRMPATAIARNLDEAVRAADAIGYPVVMKVISKDIIHKSDFGGVALDLVDRGEVIDAFQAIMHACRSKAPTAHIEGVEVSEMVQFKTETIVGARRDRAFGPVVMFGLGGIYVEVMKDVAFRAYPLNASEALHMVKETRSYPLLLGVRGEKRKDIDAVVDTVIRLGALVRRVPAISDIELNPLVVYEVGSGVKALDVRILLSSQE
jgi:acetyltransferase